MNYLAVDFGEKKIGLARNINSVVKRLDSIANNADAVANLLALIEKYEIGKIIVGLPLNYQSQETEQAKKIKQNVGRWQKRIKIPIVFENEILTSIEAQNNLRTAGCSAEEIKKSEHSEAAGILLEQHLNDDEKK